MHGLLDHGLIWPIWTIFFWQIDTPGFKKVSKWYFGVIDIQDPLRIIKYKIAAIFNPVYSLHFKHKFCT